jgi:hypothetical protein
MSDQEILDAIDAEIAEMEAASRSIDLGSKGAAATVLCHTAYASGLRFARSLIARRMEGGK